MSIHRRYADHEVLGVAAMILGGWASKPNFTIAVSHVKAAVKLAEELVDEVGKRAEARDAEIEAERAQEPPPK